MTSVPFSASSHLWDAFDLDGVLRVGPDALVIEYEGEWTKVDDNGKAAEPVTWDATTLKIPFADIVTIRLARRPFGSPRVLLQVRSLQAVTGFPLAKGVQCDIPVARKHHREATALVAEVEDRAADAELRRLEQG
ncbi:MAG: hypothetical protein ACHQQ3_00820 [Gemmatimonadales bacterium]